MRCRGVVQGLMVSVSGTRSAPHAAAPGHGRDRGLVWLVVVPKGKERP